VATSFFQPFAILLKPYTYKCISEDCKYEIIAVKRLQLNSTLCMTLFLISLRVYMYNRSSFIYPTSVAL